MKTYCLQRWNYFLCWHAVSINPPPFSRTHYFLPAISSTLRTPQACYPGCTCALWKILYYTAPHDLSVSARRLDIMFSRPIKLFVPARKKNPKNHVSGKSELSLLSTTLNSKQRCQLLMMTVAQATRSGRPCAPSICDGPTAVYFIFC